MRPLVLLVAGSLLAACSADSAPGWQMQDQLVAVDGRTWVVGNHLVTVAPDASLVGAVAPGATVNVVGRRSARGELVAERVEVVEAPVAPPRETQVQPAPPSQPVPAHGVPERRKKSGRDD